MAKPLRTPLLVMLLTLCFGSALAAEPPPVASVKPHQLGPGQVVLWLAVELHFLAIMVLAGSALLAVLMDSCSSILGQSLVLGDGLWRHLYSRLSVMFSFLGLAGLAVAGLFPHEAQNWLGFFAPTFGTHVYFGLVGLAGGYGVLCCSLEADQQHHAGQVNLAFIAVESLLTIGFVSYLLGMHEFAGEAVLKATVCFAIPAISLAWFRYRNHIHGLRLTFESTSAFAFLVLLNIASAWRNANPDESLLRAVFHTMALRETIFHAIAAVGLVSLLELAGDLGPTATGLFSKELRRAGGDSRWFLATSVLSMTLLPFMGFLASKEAAQNSWFLVFQGGLAFAILLALNYELWTRLEIAKAKAARRSWLWAGTFILGSMVLLTPALPPLSDAEIIALAGLENSPGFAIWGTAPLKTVAFTLMSLASFDACMSMIHTEIQHPALSIQAKPKFQAIVWLTGLCALIFCLGGFFDIRGAAAPGSTWDLAKLSFFETHLEGYRASLENSRKDAWTKLGLSQQPSFPLEIAKLEQSRLGLIPAVQMAWRLRDLNSERNKAQRQQQQILSLTKHLKQIKLDSEEHEALTLETLIDRTSPPEAVAHFKTLKVLLRAKAEKRLLRTYYRLSESDRRSLLLPLLLALAHMIALLLTCGRMSRDGWSAGYKSLMAWTAIELLLLFLWSHTINLESPALLQRLYGLDQVLILSSCVFLGVTRLALMSLSDRVKALHDACSLGLKPHQARLHKFEVIAAIAFVFTLILGGWAQSGAILSDIKRVTWSSRGSWILCLVTSADSSPLGSAIKATVVVGITLALVLAATRFFLWATRSPHDKTEQSWSMDRQQLLVVCGLGILFLAYLVLEWTALGVILIVFTAVLSWTDARWHVVPWLGTLFVLLFLVVGVECSKLDVVKGHRLLRWGAGAGEQNR